MRHDRDHHRVINSSTFPCCVVVIILWPPSWIYKVKLTWFLFSTLPSSLPPYPYLHSVVERELNVPLPLAKIIKKWNNLLQEYKAIKMSEEPKRRDWPFFNMMDVYFSDQVNDPTLRLFSSTKTFGTDNLDDCDFKDSIGMSNAIAAANAITAQIKRENSMNREYNNNNRDMANNNHASTLDIADMMQDTKSIGSMDDDSVSLNLTTTNHHHISRMQEHNNNNVSFTNNNNYSSSKNQNNNNNNNGGSAYPDYDDVAMEPLVQHSQPAQTQQNHHHNQKPHDPVPRQKDVSREELLQQAEHHNIDQYLLSWNNFYGNMCRGFHSLQKDEKMVDVTIAAGGKIFKAHKLVLSVCSPYFQKIFLEHPSNHPILFMTDVHSNYMAGLLDFMYSGQVNVKYEDLPNFLKVAEAMQIKGLHNESTSTEPEADSNNNKRDMKNNNNNNSSSAQNQNQTNNNNNSKTTNLNFKPPAPASSPSPYMMDAYQQQQQQMLLATQQQQHFRNLMSSTPKPSPPLQRNSTSQPPITSTTPAPSALAAAAAAAAALRSLNNASPFGSNQSNGSNNNRESPSQTSPKYQIHSTSKSMLDNTKHQKYFSKRKISSIDAIADTISQSVASAAGNGNADGDNTKRHKLLIHHNQHQEEINNNYKKLMMMANNNNNNINNNNNTDLDEDDSVTETSAAQSTTSTNNTNGPSMGSDRQSSASPILNEDKMIKMEPETQLESSTNMTSSTTATGNDEDEVYYADSPTSNSTLSAAAKLRHSILESHLRQNENSAFAGKLAFNRPQTS